MARLSKPLVFQSPLASAMKRTIDPPGFTSERGNRGGGVRLGGLEGGRGSGGRGGC